MIDLINYENNYNLKSILLGITRNPGSIYGPNPTEKEDPRNVIFVALLDRLLKIKNIDVYIINIHIHTIPDNLLKQTKIFDFNLHKDFIDYCITWQGIICKFDSPFYKEYQYFINKGIPCIMYEHGPLNGTLLFDKEPLSNSIYVNNLQQIVQNNYNEFEYNSYKEYILKNRLSKYTRLKTNQIILANGADKAFRLITEAFIDSKNEAISRMKKEFIDMENQMISASNEAKAALTFAKEAKAEHAETIETIVKELTELERIQDSHKFISLVQRYTKNDNKQKLTKLITKWNNALFQTTRSSGRSM